MEITTSLLWHDGQWAKGGWCHDLLTRIKVKISITPSWCISNRNIIGINHLGYLDNSQISPSLLTTVWWCHKVSCCIASLSASVKVLVCHLLNAMSYFLHFFTLSMKLNCNSNLNLNIFIEENAFENAICKMPAILFRPQCVYNQKRTNKHFTAPLLTWSLCHYNNTVHVVFKIEIKPLQREAF